MPFENHGNRSFTMNSIYKNAPAESGVYGLSNSQHWIYIGESSNLRLQLMDHLRKADGFGVGQRPTGFTYELCAPEDRVARQNRLVSELEPLGDWQATEA
jgi:hypothetical protein